MWQGLPASCSALSPVQEYVLPAFLYSENVAQITLTLIGKPACHLCEDAEAVVATVVDSFPRLTITVEALSIEDDEDLHEAYWDQIPVLLINGKVHNYWRIDAERLTTALQEYS